ncbi:U2 snRNP complex subunit CUS1 KNAG_0J00670 [Huiozyma naganishii CBS 8797]|uniref:PSP proline-rich domain-containing protein n=1 Tax=Huiozyma naganishii (strain ATCC MYA-139 / BCRC 22969 / CBS 8797 / KCTC 17520 / NBRC 10181 / NCYC 3082 / Yp74L-3) TaxID=1071383 RepID=J7RB98_HUIN7|nr:hypothetical protein KNAG_0J00670 [Kazachstania naganishii CBS 8797]CCK72150.1 hypothetical protein KNAG_0J00670 [Kazachstania naganishii CBS 8797]
MGRCRKRRAKAVSGTPGVLGAREQLVAVLETRASKHGKDEGPLVSPQGDARLREQFSGVLKRFEGPRVREQRVRNSDVQVKVYHDGDAPPQGDDEAAVVDESPVDDELQVAPLSKRQARKVAKPSLVELKAAVLHPECIEWYDCDAQYPVFAAKIKSSKNVVPVPVHWQMKRDYLSGRSLMGKRPFELPDIIKQTKIEEMRKTLPNDPQDREGEDAGNAAVTLKETARAKVQPKLGSLDIDFKKFHDIFFKLGTHWKPDLLLPFGDLFYENRNMQEEAEWIRLKREKRPGKLSPGLREAMGLHEGQLPPWCMKMSKLGMPPSYPTLKVAGLNWGIEHLRDDVYGKLPKDKKKSRTTGADTLFGTILSFDEPEEEDNEGESEPEPEQVGDHQEEEEQPEEHDGAEHITSIEIGNRADNDQSTDDKDKSLYTVLSETISSEQASTTTNIQKAYAMPSAGPTSKEQDEDTNEATDQEQGKDDALEKFKF